MMEQLGALKGISQKTSTRTRSGVTHSMPLRIVIYVVGVLLLSIGVVFTTRSDLGASTFNAIPLVISDATHLVTLGQACIIIYALDVVIQVVVFCRLTTRMVLQIPFAFAFGMLVDVVDFALASDLFPMFHDPDWVMGAVMLVLGLFATGVGVSMVMNMNFVPNPPDGCTQAVCKLTGLPFGRAKWLNDAIRFCVACALGMLLMGQIYGVGIGTVAAVFCIGNICQFVDDHVSGLYRKVYVPANPA